MKSYYWQFFQGTPSGIINKYQIGMGFAILLGSNTFLFLDTINTEFLAPRKIDINKYILG